MSFNLMLPPILGVVGLVIAFVIYTVMSRASDGNAKERGIAEQIHIGANHLRCEITPVMPSMSPTVLKANAAAADVSCCV